MIVLIVMCIYFLVIYEMPYRDSPHHEIESLLSSNYLNLFKQMNTEEIITLENQTI